MEERSCRDCVYLIRVKNCAEISICVNRAGKEGSLFVIGKSGTRDSGLGTHGSWLAARDSSNRHTGAEAQRHRDLGARDEECRNYKKLISCARINIQQPVGEGVRLIALTRGKFAIVERRDFERLSQYKWHSLFNGRKTYANRSFAGRNISMHRFIMRPARGMVVDHIDGNGLNNTRRNLRVCTARENLLNSRGRGKSSRFKGVCRHRGKWQVSMKIGGRSKYIGSYETEIEAARAYDRAAKKWLGEFAYLNLV